MPRQSPLPSRDCDPKPELDSRPLLESAQASALEDVFKVLANDTRLRILHALARAPDICVGDLAAALGMKPQAVSNQLQRLTDQRILASRRDGTRIHYRIVDPCTVRLLELGLCLLQDMESADRSSLRSLPPGHSP